MPRLRSQGEASIGQEELTKVIRSERDRKKVQNALTHIFTHNFNFNPLQTSTPKTHIERIQRPEYFNLTITSIPNPQHKNHIEKQIEYDFNPLQTSTPKAHIIRAKTQRQIPFDFNPTKEITQRPTSPKPGSSTQTIQKAETQTQIQTTRFPFDFIQPTPILPFKENYPRTITKTEENRLKTNRELHTTTPRFFKITK